MIGGDGTQCPVGGRNLPLSYAPGLLGKRDYTLLPYFTLSYHKHLCGNPERCWKSQGACREECTKHEKFYILCWSGKMCCVKSQKVPQLSQDLD
ncbi:hypothetical protein U0070_025056 [Myodes glareolus]|uniref:Beta-defensin n=1 Tax=Myodes glareolus TaxID=447135 RepID=A0AAW0HZA8_MYOGA